mmetsp:Transcript_64110/g.198495  ORF Transcript_64110/g.198495 Transcript_64110/m.198495 type:complete len:359 (+) Transcript_64110:56-1132(+)
MEENGNTHGSRNMNRRLTTAPVCCRCCRFRRHKRGALASQVLIPRKFLRVWFDFGAALAVVANLMLVPDTFLALTSACLSVLVFQHWGPQLSANLSWTAASFMIAFPLQNAIKEAYHRREQALRALVDFRATLLSVYLANTVWDWPGAEACNGRSEDNRPKDLGGTGVKKGPCNRPLPQAHGERVRELLFRLLDAVQEVLLVPRAGHARLDFPCGREEKQQVESCLTSGREAVLKLLSRLQYATEDLKAAGMPANEASRINQYNMLLVREFERLWAAKTYNTPIALRAVLRVFIQALPFCYGPYWLHIARGDYGYADWMTTTFAIVFASMISLLLIALVNLQEQLENPFRDRCRTPSG